MTTPRARRRLARRTTPDAVAVAPFTVLIDTREQLPWDFAGIKADAAQGGPAGGNLVVPVAGGTLGAGDYSIHGHGGRVAVERKSLADLFGTIGQGRDRFERELERLNGLEFAAVIVEAELSEAKLNPPSYSQVQFKTVTRSAIAWQQRFKGVHWCWLPGRYAAMVWAYRVLERWWKDVAEVEERTAGKDPLPGEQAHLGDTNGTL